ncbi:DUF4258 domain-containing protein [Pseudomonas sp. R2.Fl]|nr:DUF4258 domain-containing protein [Pseudomonas sp. R2.Fl]
MSKPLHFTAHALTVIRERQLDANWVEQAVRAPDWRETDPSGSPAERRYRRIPECGNRILRVICLETDSEIRIITAFLDRKARQPQ